jgi:tetratricopeptide (TPR) repeat protein
MIRRGPVVFLFAAALLALSLPTIGLAQAGGSDAAAAKEAFNEGIKQMKAGSNDLAVTLFQTAIAKDPNLVDAYLNLGALYFQTKKYDEALEQFRKVTQKDPKSVEGFANLGRVQNLLKRPVEAEESFKAALALKPDDVAILTELGKIQYIAQRYTDAVATFEQCHGGNETTWYYLGKSYQKQDKMTAAITALEKALTFDAKNYNAHFALGQIYLGQQKYSKASSSFKAALNADGTKYLASYNYAIAVESEFPDNSDTNIANWSSFVRMAKNNPKAKNEVANAEAHLKELQDAKAKQ